MCLLKATRLNMQIVFLILFCALTFCLDSVEAKRTIGFFTYQGCGGKPWDPDSIKSGITGSEEAIIYMSKELAELGFAVTVFANPPDNSSYSLPTANPRYVPCIVNEDTKLDIAIAWRTPGSVDVLKQIGKHVYLWPHDTFHWHMPLDQINTFKDVLWLSKWQRDQWISVNPAFVKFNKIFGNGITPNQFQPIQERTNPHSCIYGSNYARGLELLLDIWPEVKKEFPKATLDIYYGWQHWGLLSPEKEKKMRKQIEDLVSLEVHEHGLVGHEELNRAYEKASLWTYPCIAPETFCITGIRAQLSGAIPVIIEGSALKETVRYGYKCQKPEEYLATLLQALRESDKISVEDRKKMGEFVLKEYTWKSIAEKWKVLFDSNQ